VTPMVAHLRGCPPGSKNKATIAAGAGATAGASSPAVAVSGLSHPTPAYEPPAYDLVDGYVSFIISVLALGAGHPPSTQVYGDDGGVGALPRSPAGG
jgi:hypothetical protein